jgi:hypothetical protein
MRLESKVFTAEERLDLDYQFIHDKSHESGLESSDDCDFQS